MIGNGQMLILGGLDSEWNWAAKDTWISGMRILDLTKLQWSDAFDANAMPYKTPGMVQDWYNQG